MPMTIAPVDADKEADVAARPVTPMAGPRVPPSNTATATNAAGEPVTFAPPSQTPGQASGVSLSGQPITATNASLAGERAASNQTHLPWGTGPQYHDNSFAAQARTHIADVRWALKGKYGADKIDWANAEAARIDALHKQVTTKSPEMPLPGQSTGPSAPIASVPDAQVGPPSGQLPTSPGQATPPVFQRKPILLVPGGGEVLDPRQRSHMVQLDSDKYFTDDIPIGTLPPELQNNPKYQNLPSMPRPLGAGARRFFPPPSAPPSAPGQSVAATLGQTPTENPVPVAAPNNGVPAGALPPAPPPPPTPVAPTGIGGQVAIPRDSSPPLGQTPTANPVPVGTEPTAPATLDEAMRQHLATLPVAPFGGGLDGHHFEAIGTLQGIAQQFPTPQQRPGYPVDHAGIRANQVAAGQALDAQLGSLPPDELDDKIKSMRDAVRSNPKLAAQYGAMLANSKVIQAYDKRTESFDSWKQRQGYMGDAKKEYARYSYDLKNKMAGMKQDEVTSQIQSFDPRRYLTEQQQQEIKNNPAGALAQRMDEIERIKADAGSIPPGAAMKQIDRVMMGQGILANAPTAREKMDWQQHQSEAKGDVQQQAQNLQRQRYEAEVNIRKHQGDYARSERQLAPVQKEIDRYNEAIFAAQNSDKFDGDEPARDKRVAALTAARDALEAKAQPHRTRMDKAETNLGDWQDHLAAIDAGVPHQAPKPLPSEEDQKRVDGKVKAAASQPAAQPASQPAQATAVPVGTIVDGHQFTGTAWIPVGPTKPPKPAQVIVQGSTAQESQGE